MRSLVSCATAFLSRVGFSQSLPVLPPSVNLTTAESHQQLLAEATIDNYQQDWTRKVKWASSNPNIATVGPNGLVNPVSDGDAIITADNKASVKVHVQGTKAPFAW